MRLASSTPLIRSPWTAEFDRLVSLAEESLLVASPFIKVGAVERMLRQLEVSKRSSSIRLSLITDLRPDSALGAATDLQAITEIGRRVASFEVTHLPSLHAKVYVADERMAVVSSANLTEPGLWGNLEYGIAVEDASIVREVRSDFEGYSLLGAKVALAEIQALWDEVKDLKKLQARAEHSSLDGLRRAFSRKLESIGLRVLRHRARGKTNHAIFADTIRFLLAKRPMTTMEMHPLIKLIHPDLCNDLEDRVIDGVHFGKKWKHYVRNAQQSLKRRGEIKFDGKHWLLA